jgi:hypothetical protein
MQTSFQTKKLAYYPAILVAVFAVLNIYACNNTPAVRVDGVYQSKKDGSSYEYLHFFADGSVITVSSEGTPTDIAKWFIKDSPSVSKGKYILTGQHIKFSSTDSYGSVDYDGDIKDDILYLKTFSHINNYRGSDEFKFVKN